MKALKNQGIGKPSQLTLAALIDTSLNQGATGREGSIAIAKKVGKGRSETAFLKRFLKLRKPIAGTESYNWPPINGTKRCQQFLDLLRAKEMDLRNADRAIKKVTSWTME